MKSVLQVGPLDEPIALEDAKEYMRETSTAQDELIEHILIPAARKACEEFTNRVFVQQTWRGYMDTFPDRWCDRGMIRLPKGPVLSITHIKYYDETNTLQTYSSSLYQSDLVSVPARVVPVYGECWPSTYTGKLNAVEIEYVCGYGAEAEDVPEPIRNCIMAMVSHLYDNRANMSDPGFTQVPLHIALLLSPYRVFWFD